MSLLNKGKKYVKREERERFKEGPGKIQRARGYRATHASIDEIRNY